MRLLFVPGFCRIYPPTSKEKGMKLRDLGFTEQIDAINLSTGASATKFKAKTAGSAATLARHGHLDNIDSAAGTVGFRINTNG